MNTLTQEQKLKLARMLPEKIATRQGAKVDSFTFHWLDNPVEWKGNENDEPLPQVTDREWLYICALIEQTLNSEQCFGYDMALSEILASRTRVCDCANLPGDYVWHLTCERRAEALIKVLG